MKNERVKGRKDENERVKTTRFAEPQALRIWWTCFYLRKFVRHLCAICANLWTNARTPIILIKLIYTDFAANEKRTEPLTQDAEAYLFPADSAN